MWLDSGAKGSRACSITGANLEYTCDTTRVKIKPAAALRGAEMGVEVMLKATKVDGIYSSDPKLDPSATLYHTITFDEALIKNLQVMDATAFALCRDRKLPIRVFSILKPGALMRVVLGESEGTLVHV